MQQPAKIRKAYIHYMNRQRTILKIPTQRKKCLLVLFVYPEHIGFRDLLDWLSEIIN